MDRIRVGIIGQGRSGRDIHRHLLETQPRLMSKFDVVAVADPIAERCAAVNAGANPECRIFPDYRELLRDRNIELVVNASRSLRHVNIGIEAMEAGFGVVCEKPLARNVSEVDRVLAAAERTGKFFAVFQQSRFRPIFTKSLEIMRSGVLGRPVMVKLFYNGFGRRYDWQTVQDMCAGNLLNTGPHPLDQALQFYGDADPERVVSILDNVNSAGDAEDHVKLLLIGKGHPTVDMEASSCQLYNPYIIQIYASNGSLAATAGEVQWKYFLPNDAPEIKLSIEPLEAPGRLPAYCGAKGLFFFEEKWIVPDTAAGMDYMGVLYYENIFDAFRSGAPLLVKNAEVRRQIAVIEECHRQNPLPKTVKIDPSIF